MPNTIRVLRAVLVEHATRIVFDPGAGIHGVGADELEQPEAVVCLRGARGGVDDEGLVGGGVGELFGAFVGGEAVVYSAVVRGLFPPVRGYADDAALGEGAGDGPGVGH